MSVGIDAVLNTDPGSGEFEWDIQWTDEGDILTEDTLDTAIYVSLFTDRRAKPDQISDPKRRRGWIGDLENAGDLWGSWLWLLEQSRLTRVVADSSRNYTDIALAWLVTSGIATEVSTRTFVTTSTGLQIESTIRRPNGETESTLVSLWDNTGD